VCNHTNVVKWFLFFNESKTLNCFESRSVIMELGGKISEKKDQKQKIDLHVLLLVYSTLLCYIHYTISINS